MAKHRLLLVEDDYDVAEMLLMFFETQGYEVVHADNGTDGVALARSRFPNVILLDVMLPDMDGYDVCLRLRRSALTKFIPILFLTQRDERASKVRGLELGADDYITKPFDIDELRLRVKGTINRATRENLHETRTGLPTGPLVEDEIRYKQTNSPDFVAVIFSVDGLQTYHDVYGFVAANDVLNYAGSLIQRHISQYGTPDDFVGIQEDEFIVLTHSDDPDAITEMIVHEFNQGAQAFYAFSDLEDDQLVMDRGTSQEQIVPLMHFRAEYREVTTDA